MMNSTPAFPYGGSVNAHKVDDDRCANLISFDDREYLVEDILDQWYGPADTVLKVRASDEHVYILRYRSNEDEWTLVAFRRS
jgi:hypothetical protein